MSRACILISTCDKYQKVATFTRAMIDRYWAAHPPVWLCGVGNSSGPEWLPLRNDPADWVGITLSAVEDLMARGYDQGYLILEDHPPLGPCNSGHLNQTLPAMMDELKAAYIGLYGWDQRTPSKGTLLDRNHFRLQKQDASFLWQFSLHPALWNLPALKDLLSTLAQARDPSSHSPWAFERRSGADGFTVPDSCRDRAYRVCGLSMLGGRGRRWRKYARGIEFRLIDCVRLFCRLVHADNSLARWDALMSAEYDFHDGPYPLYWSGVLRKGKPNENLHRFLQWRRRLGYLVELERSTRGES